VVRLAKTDLKKTDPKGEDASGSPKKKMAKGKKITVIVLSCVLAVLIVAVGVAAVFVYGKWDNRNKDSFNASNVPASSGDIPSAAAALIPMPTTNFDAYGIASNANVENIMLIGSDSRTNNPLDGRSDSAILISINKNTKQIYMSSFMRDMFVPIPGKGQNRINAAFAVGGPSLYLQTVTQDFRIQVDKYVVVGFNGFEKVIDDVGGIDVTLTKAEVVQVNGLAEQWSGQPSHVVAGLQHLNGYQALAYARIREIDTDFVRTQRQRTVMMDIFGKFKALSLPQLNTTMNDILPNLNTNLSTSDLTSLLAGALTYKNWPVTQIQVPENGAWSDMVVSGMDVLKVNFDANIQMLQKTIYGVSASSPASTSGASSN